MKKLVNDICGMLDEGKIDTKPKWTKKFQRKETKPESAYDNSVHIPGFGRVSKDWARKNGYSEHIKEELDVKTLSPEAIAKLHDISIDEINNQLAKGIEIEKEHTTDPKVAREIALDHIKEDPKYYDKLKKVEEMTTIRYAVVDKNNQARFITADESAANRVAKTKGEGHEVRQIFAPKEKNLRGATRLKIKKIIDGVNQ